MSGSLQRRIALSHDWSNTEARHLAGVCVHCRNPSISASCSACCLSVLRILFACFILVPLLAGSLIEKVVRQEPRWSMSSARSNERYRREVPLFIP